MESVGQSSGVALIDPCVVSNWTEWEQWVLVSASTSSGAPLKMPGGHGQREQCDNRWWPKWVSDRWNEWSIITPHYPLCRLIRTLCRQKWAVVTRSSLVHTLLLHLMVNPKNCHWGYALHVWLVSMTLLFNQSNPVNTHTATRVGQTITISKKRDEQNQRKAQKMESTSSLCLRFNKLRGAEWKVLVD